MRTIHALLGVVCILAAGCESPRPLLGTGGAAPEGELLPVPGELFIIHPHLEPSFGDTTIVVGPDGSITIIDVGGGASSGPIRAIVEWLNDEFLTPERGYPVRRGSREIEHLIFTHEHNDHIGGAPELLGGYDQLDLRGRIVFRGWVEPRWGDRYTRTCEAATTYFPDQIVALCESADQGPAPCWPDGDGHPATSCPGLRAGDLTTPADDDAGGVAYLPLGDGARLYLAGADGFFGDERFAGELTENGRSLVGLIVHGGFRYHFGGDLNGGGPDLTGESYTEDVEAVFLSAREGLEGLPADGLLYDDRGVDVLRAHHHGLASSNLPALLDALLPADGHARNVVIAIGREYPAAPPQSLFDALGVERLAGGGVWQTGDPGGGGTSAVHALAHGAIRIRTTGMGSGYWMQALFHDDPNDTLTAGFTSVH